MIWKIVKEQVLPFEFEDEKEAEVRMEELNEKETNKEIRYIMSNARND